MSNMVWGWILVTIGILELFFLFTKFPYDLFGKALPFVVLASLIGALMITFGLGLGLRKIK